MSTDTDTKTVKRITAYSYNPLDLVIVGLDTEAKKGNVLYDERLKLKLDEGMIRNIMFHGVHTAIVVRKNGSAVEVVDGKQRVRHARAANERLLAEGKEPILVPAMIRRGNDNDMLGVMISANELRRNDDIMIKSKKLARYLNMGHTVEEAADQFGVTVPCIKNWEKLSDVSSKVGKAVVKGLISASAAGRLSSLSREDQDIKLAEMLAAAANGGPKATAAEAQRQAQKAQNGGEAPVQAWSKPNLKKLVSFMKDSDAEDTGMTADFLKGIQFAIGLRKANTVKGLTSALDQAIEGPKRERKAEAEAKKAAKAAEKAAKAEAKTADNAAREAAAAADEEEEGEEEEGEEGTEEGSDEFE